MDSKPIVKVGPAQQQAHQAKLQPAHELAPKLAYRPGIRKTAARRLFEDTSTTQEVETFFALAQHQATSRAQTAVERLGLDDAGLDAIRSAFPTNFTHTRENS